MDTQKKLDGPSVDNFDFNQCDVDGVDYYTAFVSEAIRNAVKIEVESWTKQNFDDVGLMLIFGEYNIPTGIKCISTGERLV